MASETVARSNVISLAFGSRARPPSSHAGRVEGPAAVVPLPLKPDLDGFYAWVFRDCRDADDMGDWEVFKAKRQEPTARAKFAAIERHYGYVAGSPPRA